MNATPCRTYMHARIKHVWILLRNMYIQSSIMTTTSSATHEYCTLLNTTCMCIHKLISRHCKRMNTYMHMHSYNESQTMRNKLIHRQQHTHAILILVCRIRACVSQHNINSRKCIHAHPHNDYTITHCAYWFIHTTCIHQWQIHTHTFTIRV